MSACTFFGHRDCRELKRETLQKAVEALLAIGVDTFYVGSQGGFDRMVYGVLKQLQQIHPALCVCIVLAYPPESSAGNMEDTMYPEIEGHPKFAIERRNRWMVEASQYCICYITHTWGGAYKFAKLASSQGKTVINLAGAPAFGEGAF